MTKAANNNKKKTIFILYIPGGAMLGIIPGVVLARLEELTETPAIELFQVTDAVSTGSILVAGMNIRDPENPQKPKLNAQDMVELFCTHGPRFFPPTPGRRQKMITANVINTMEDHIDPLKIDTLALDEINALCDELSKKVNTDLKPDLEKIQKLATQRWLTKGTQKKVLKICEKITTAHPELDKCIGPISELVYVRTSTGSLSSIFKKSVLGSMNAVKKYWAKDYMYDPAIPKKVFQDLFGDARVGDSLRSTYISTFEPNRNAVKTFSYRKNDFFSQEHSETDRISEGNHKLWDIVLASTANPFAYPPHTTEDGIVCSDKATVHTPLHCVQDIVARKPDDVDVKLVILGTGKYLTKEQNNNDDQDNNGLRDYYVKYGVAGNLLKGKELAELEGYTMSQAHTTLRRLLGRDNIIEISPRLSPRTHDETKEFPAKSPLDASQDNVRKILKRARALLVKDDEAIRNLSQMLVENLYNLDQISEEKYERVTKKIGVKTEAHPLESGIGKKIPSIFRKVFPHRTIRETLSALFSRKADNDNDEDEDNLDNDRKDEPKGPHTGTDGPAP